MALFGSSRDISFMLKVNKELLNDIIQQEVDYYQKYLPETKAKDTGNLYGEASAQKTYYAPVRVTCLIDRQDQATVQEDQFGMDVTQAVTFKFLRPALKEINLVPGVGDIIELRGSYYEVDGIVDNQFIMGRDGEYPKNVGSEFGENLSMICNTHLARVARLQIIKARS